MFRLTRLKLTAWYLLIIMFISLMFSLIIYRVLSGEIERFERLQRFRLEQRFSNRPPIAVPELLEEAKHRIAAQLAIINLGILIISGGLGYFLAGKNLQPIKDMMDEQSRFISDASHELRTPLTSLKTAMEVYLRNKAPTTKEAKALISENILEVNKLTQLSDELLQLTQYQKSNGNLKFEILSLSEIIKEAKRKMEPIADNKSIKIITKVDNEKIQGNKDGLVNLFVILLDNAVKYSHKKSFVTIQSQKSDKIITIKVIDKGIGIDEKDLPHIFSRFYRADSARAKSGAGGYGLGLSIAKKIIETHDGTIKVESKIGKGSIFTVRLPIILS